MAGIVELWSQMTIAPPAPRMTMPSRRGIRAARRKAAVVFVESGLVVCGLSSRYAAVRGVLGAKTDIRFYDNITETVAEIAKRDSSPLFLGLGGSASALMLRVGNCMTTASGAGRLTPDDLQKAQRFDIGAVSRARTGFQSLEAQIVEWTQRLLPEGGCVCGAPPQTIPLRLLVIGELETVRDGPMAFSSGEPVAYATGPPTIRSRSVASHRPTPNRS